MLHIIPLNRWNWDKYLSIQVESSQEDFLPSVLFSIAQSKFENLIPCGINQDDKIVGFVMYGDLGGIIWINRIMIDVAFQRKGLARESLILLLSQIRTNYFSQMEIRTSYARKNLAAKALFEGLGFEAINDHLAEEIVAIYKG